MARTASRGGVPLWGRIDNYVVLALVLSGILVVLAIGRDYGRSWDEPGTAIYAQRTLNAYSGDPSEEYHDLSFYGPAYMVFSELLGRMVAGLPGWSLIDGRHAAYYMSFLAAVVSVYVLARGGVGVGPALAGALLFATQPLLFGHAFINPKDMPFLGLFAGAMAVGAVAVRALPASSAANHEEAFLSGWRSARPLGRLVWGAVLVVGIALLVEIVALKRIVLPAILRVVTDAYNGEAGGIIQWLFATAATDRWKTGLEAYLAKTEQFYAVGSTAMISGFVLVMLAWSVLSYFPTRRRQAAWIAAAGVVAGLATAVRVAGPLAAVLVSSLIVYRLRRQAVMGLVVYWSVLGAIVYLAWPYLWESPVQSFLEAARMMSQFPWSQEVLFAGRQIAANDLPWVYAPAHFSLQLTLPALVLGLGGGIVALLPSHSGLARAEAVVFWLWLVLPFAATIGFGSVLYDGARQLLFAVPPLFVMAAIAFRWIFGYTRRPWIRTALVCVALLPGILALVSLHPYQYIYFNALAGGVRGAFRRYELDYWGTSYREAMQVLANVAPSGASVGVAGKLEVAQPYARPDLVVFWQEEETPDAPDFLVVTTRWNLDLALWPDAPDVYLVQRGGAVLARVIDLRGIE